MTKVLLFAANLVALSLAFGPQPPQPESCNPAIPSDLLGNLGLYESLRDEVLAPQVLDILPDEALASYTVSLTAEPDNINSLMMSCDNRSLFVPTISSSETIGSGSDGAVCRHKFGPAPLELVITTFRVGGLNSTIKYAVTNFLIPPEISTDDLFGGYGGDQFAALNEYWTFTPEDDGSYTLDRYSVIFEQQTGPPSTSTFCVLDIYSFLHSTMQEEVEAFAAALV